MSDAKSSFLQAQRRVAERHRLRDAQPASGRGTGRGDAEAGLGRRLLVGCSHLPRQLVDGIGFAWAAASSREGTRPGFRVAQVDAELLDEELVELLKRQLGDGLRYLGDGHLLDDWSAEIRLALRALLFKLTLWDSDATYGASLQSLVYVDARQPGPLLVPPSRGQKALHGLTSVLGRYAWGRWEDWLLQAEGDPERPPTRRTRFLSRWTERLSTAHSAAALVSFLLFLLQGRYRSLLDRLLRMRLVAPTGPAHREVSLEYLNRQLVWHSLTEFLLFFLPLIGLGRWRRWLARAWRAWRRRRRGGDGQAEGEDGAGEYSVLPERTCAICRQEADEEAAVRAEAGATTLVSALAGAAQTDVTNAYEGVPCGCVYCFVCLATRIEREEGDGWTCLRCGQLIRECRPWRGDLLEADEGGGVGGAKEDGGEERGLVTEGAGQDQRPCEATRENGGRGDGRRRGKPGH